jgi:FHA domain
MFQPWRLKLREAEEALRSGQLEEAGRLLRTAGLNEFLPGKRLMEKVAEQIAQRAQRRVAVGQTLDGWRDLETAAQLGANASLVDGLRQRFVRQGLAEVEAYLAAGDPPAAAERLAQLERQHASNREVRLLKETTTRVLAAQRRCHRGEFAEAEQDLAAAAALRPDLKVLDDLRKACRVKADACGRLAGRLYEAMAKADWNAVLTCAEALQELCPEHPAAVDARRRAWAVVGTCLSNRNGNGHGEFGARPHGEPALPRVNAMSQPTDSDAGMGQPSGPRFLLWVDGVGGYLVCQGDEIALGQPAPGGYIDVPILADVSRRHAIIRRDAESYVIEPRRDVCVNGRAIESLTLLADGSLIELGGGTRLRFRLPHPLSRTARLEFVSHHRTQPSTDGVLLMAESCVLGPGSKSHIVCPNWPADVVLFSQGDQLHCRTAGRFQIDGVEVDGRGPIGRSSQVVGEHFSMSLEEV